MNGRIIRLGPGECSNMETGARFLAAVAFPRVKEDQERQEAAAAYVASYLHQANRIDESKERFTDDCLNAFAGLSPQCCRQKLRTANRRFRDRSHMGRALRLWVTEALGYPVKMPEGLDSLTQEKTSLWLNHNQEEVANNYRKRTWRPGLPVAHIAIATDLIWRSPDRDDVPVAIHLSDIATIERIVSLANALEPLLCSVPRFKIVPETLLHLDWVG